MSRPETYADLEIGLHRIEAETYQVELRFSDPASEADVPPARGPAALDAEELLALESDPEAYGRALADGLFHDDDVRGLYARARSAAEASGSFLRVRLLVGAGAPELHALRWELLVDPESKAPLATSERTLLSRFMLSRDWRPVKLRPKSDLRAAVAVAAPSDLARYKLADVDAAGEVGRATAALAGINVDVVGKGEPLSLERLVAALRGGVDVLYLVCHGVLTRKQVSYLFLQDEEGKVARVEGEKLAQAVAELRQPPRLVVLASCDSATPSQFPQGDGAAPPTTSEGRATAQASLAPLLAEAGVPAILAMQGKISMETIERAMPVFFTELLQDGRIDRAMAVARAAVRERHDAWMPALFLRLKRGRIWYVPGFSDDSDFSKWPSITTSAMQGSLVPMVGPDVAEHVYGTARDLARRLSRRHDFPHTGREGTDLAKVTQYVSVEESRTFARDEVLKLRTKALLDRRPELRPSGRLPPLPKLLDKVVERQQEKDPFKILASLSAKVYVNACSDPLLLKSLKASGREPQALLCDWRAGAESHPAAPLYDDEPTVERPVVHHVFGVLPRLDSLVMTEDDFFDYLIAAVQYKLIPHAVRGALTRGSLVFLGFRLDDWTFRVLFRLIMALGGKQRLCDHAHVGVQVDPEEYGEPDLEKARRHLERYFTSGLETPPISIYWGSPQDFLEELRRQMRRATTQLPAITREDVDDWLS